MASACSCMMFKKDDNAFVAIKSMETRTANVLIIKIKRLKVDYSVTDVSYDYISS